MRDDEGEKKIRRAQEMAALLEKKIGEAVSLSLYDGDSCLPLRYREETLLEAAELSEALTGRMRELAMEAETDMETLLCYRQKVADIHRIRICYRQGIVEMELPVLLPHRKEKYTEYLVKPLSSALQSWCRARQAAGEEVPAFVHAVLCFVHCYLDGSRARDHDNIETKQVQDMMALFFLAGDDGMHLDLYHTSEQTGENRTVLYLMEQEKFPEWVVQRGW